MKKILIIEDDRKISDLVRLYLEKEGFEVEAAYDGREGVEMFDTGRPDFVILDLALPEMDGIDVARVLRTKSHVPILMLTARSEEFDKVLGLEMGADDYVTKPFSPRELVARIKAIMRRTEHTKDEELPEVIRVKDLVIDNVRMSLTRKDSAVKLSSTEFRLIALLAASPGRVFSRSQILDAMYGNDDAGVLDRTIDVHIKNIRRKLDDDPREPRYIESVFGVGYRFIE